MIGERLVHPVDRLIIFIREMRFLNELLNRIIRILAVTSDFDCSHVTQSSETKNLRN